MNEPEPQRGFLKAVAADVSALPPLIGGAELAAGYAGYLTDESRFTGQADAVAFPSHEAELLALVKHAASAGLALTLSGGRTGITGGAVPLGGLLISLEKMNHFLGLFHAGEDGGFILRCQPGVTLNAIRDAVSARAFAEAASWSLEARAALEDFRRVGPFIFPPDPTEATATLGGMTACNASGARTLFYGPTRRYIRRIRLALADGSVLDLARGQTRVGPDGSFTLVTAGGQSRTGRIPGYVMPRVKNAAGYYAEPGMDLVDLFIGSEGTLGIFSELDILLVPAPETILGVVGFFPSESHALRFVRAARGLAAVRQPTDPAPPWKPLALEYFDGGSLKLLREEKKLQGRDSAIPALPDAAETAVYIEISTTANTLETDAESLMRILEVCGSSPDLAWSATNENEARLLKAFRHALPEAVNRRIGERAAKYPGLTKLGTDMTVPDDAFETLLAFYRSTLDDAGFDYVIFGHIGNNHLHVNMLPRDLDEFRRGKELYMKLARKAVSLGGTVSGEHGIGKLKKPYLELMVGQDGLRAMQAVKRVFDPDGRLNPGNLFPDP